MKKHYNINKLSYFKCYSIDDTSILYDIHPQTAQKWLSGGLKKIDNKKPTLIYGNHIKQFLGKLNDKAKVPTEFDEIYCFHCKAPHKPLRNELYIEKYNNIFRGKAVCGKKHKIMNKTFKLEDYPKIKQLYNLVEESNIDDSLNATCKTQIKDNTPTTVNESLNFNKKDIKKC